MKTIILALTFLLAGIAIGYTQQPKTFYITFPYAIPAGTALEVVVKNPVAGFERIDALAHTGSTVWTEQEWLACGVCRTVKVLRRCDIFQEKCP